MTTPPLPPGFVLDPPAAGAQPFGQFGAGNIDLTNRPRVRNTDGSISTVRSMSANFDGKEVLLPTVSDDGRIMSDDEAIQQYLRTGQNLGSFSTVDEANAYADRLHREQESMYANAGIPPLPPGFQLDEMPITDLPAVQAAPSPAAVPAPRATDDMSGLDRFRAGIGKGLVDSAEGIAQAGIDSFSRPVAASRSAADAVVPAGAYKDLLMGAYDRFLTPQKEMREHVGERRALDQDLMDTGAGRLGGFTGAVAGSLPMGGIGMAGRGVGAARAIGQNALAGAFQGTLAPVVSDEERFKNGALGAAFGGGLSAAGRGVMRAAEEAFPPNTLARMLNYFGGKANKTPHAAESEALAQRTGIDFTPGMVSGGKAQTAVENMARQSVFTADTAFEADKRIAEQAIANVNRLMDRITPDGASGQAVGHRVQQTVDKAIDSVVERRDQTAAQQFGAIRRMVGDAKVVDYAATRRVLQDMIQENADVLGADPRRIRMQAQRMLDELSGKDGFTLESARKSRSSYGKAARGQSNLLNNVDRTVNQTFAKRMYAAISDDIDAAGVRLDEAAGFGQNGIVPQGVNAARPSELLKQANDEYRNHSDLLRLIQQSPMRRLLGDKVDVDGFTQYSLPPEKVIESMGSMKPSELEQVRHFMERQEPEVWQQYKRLLVDDALAAAETAPTSSGANHVPFNASGFLRALGGDKPAKVDQLRAIFNPGEMAEVMDAMQAARRLGDKFGANFSGTGPYAEVSQASRSFVDALKNMSVSAAVGAASPALGLKGVARMMLNADGRRGLIELAQLPPGSKRANDLAAYLASVAAVRADGGDEPLEIEITGGQPGAAPTEQEMAALRAKMAQGQ